MPLVRLVRSELVTLPSEAENVYGPPAVVERPTLYPPTLQPEAAVDADHDKLTFASPAVAETTGAVTMGKYKNPLATSYPVTELVPTAICEMVPKS